MQGRIPAGLSTLLCAGFVLCLFAVVPAGSVHAQAASTVLTPDARSQGMGRAFTAIAEGPTAVWWNPGALGLIKGINVSPISRNRLVPDLADDVWYWPSGATAGNGQVGAGFFLGRLEYGESMATTQDGEELGWFESKERMVMLGAGADLARALGFGSERLRLGAGACWKSVRLDLAPSWATPNHVAGTGSGWDLDAGLIGTYTLLTGFDPLGGGRADPPGGNPDGILRVRGGAVLHGLLDREIDFEGVGQSDPMGKSLRVGGAVETEFGAWPDLLELGPLVHGTLSLETEKPLTYPDEKSIFHAGIEGSILSVVTLRMGRIEDKEGDIRGYTYGLGLGMDYHLHEPNGRCGGRIDFADVPQARVLGRVQHVTLSGWYYF
jgi:hypothetical protein